MTEIIKSVMTDDSSSVDARRESVSQPPRKKRNGKPASKRWTHVKKYKNSKHPQAVLPGLRGILKHTTEMVSRPNQLSLDDRVGDASRIVDSLTTSGSLYEVSTSIVATSHDDVSCPDRELSDTNPTTTPGTEADTHKSSEDAEMNDVTDPSPSPSLQNAPDTRQRVRFADNNRVKFFDKLEEPTVVTEAANRPETTSPMSDRLSYLRNKKNMVDSCIWLNIHGSRVSLDQHNAPQVSALRSRGYGTLLDFLLRKEIIPTLPDMIAFCYHEECPIDIEASSYCHYFHEVNDSSWDEDQGGYSDNEAEIQGNEVDEDKDVESEVDSNAYKKRRAAALKYREACLRAWRSDRFPTGSSQEGERVTQGKFRFLLGLCRDTASMLIDYRRDLQAEGVEQLGSDEDEDDEEIAVDGHVYLYWADDF